PVKVPSAMAACAARMIQTGISFKSVRYMKWRRDDVSAKTAFEATRRPAMIPIVFWASLAPCDNEYAAADASWALRNQRSTEPYGTFRKIHEAPTIRTKPANIPRSGDTTMKASVFVHAGPHRMARMPTRATAAPA